LQRPLHRPHKNLPFRQHCDTVVVEHYKPVVVEHYKPVLVEQSEALESNRLYRDWDQKH
jgi:hypothetical protein